MKLENGAFYGTYTAILRETCKERGVMACFEDEMSSEIWEMYACRITTLEK
jgi:hypothetical protein